jgi:TRAP-type uncharacterized transport system substrate-binding protein
MIKTTITNIENKIKLNASIQDKEKTELLNLLTSLQNEVSELSKIDSEQAESITGFTQTSAHEATRKDKNEQLLTLSLKGLTSSVDELETSHPKLVEIVNRISQALSNMGI